MKLIAENEDDIVSIISAEFRTFGGGRTSNSNPIANALKDYPAQFAAGVDVKHVVKRVTELTSKICKPDNTTHSIKVIEVNRFRDGGTVIYEDELGRLYFMWSPTRKIYNQMPGIAIDGMEPKPYVKELKVNLEVVKAF